jgi:hypothetical protein
MSDFTINHCIFQPGRSSSGESMTKYIKRRQFMFIFGKILFPYRILFEESTRIKFHQNGLKLCKL